MAVAIDLTRIWSGAGLGTSRLSTTFHGAPAASTITPFIVTIITSACIVILGLCAGSESRKLLPAQNHILISLLAAEHKQLQAGNAPGRHRYVGPFIMLKSPFMLRIPSIEATSLIDLDHWRRFDARAGWVPGGWLNYGLWLAIQSNGPFLCLSNNDLIVP